MKTQDMMYAIRRSIGLEELTQTPESKFARAMDNFQPLILNNSNNGSDWREHNVTKVQVMKRQSLTELGSKEIWEYTQKIIEDNVDRGNLTEDK